MTEKGYISDIYKQLESVMIKCDSLSVQVKTIKKETETKLKKEIKELKKHYEARILELENTNIEKDAKIEKLENEIDRLKKQINNDSDNSSNPPSSDIKPNIPNNRTKSGKKPGGQVGHKSHYLSKKDVEAKIKNKEFKHEVMCYGKKSDKYVSKYIIDISVDVKAIEHRFYEDKNGKYNIPREFLTDVQYGSNLKTLCSVLNTEGIVAIDRLTDFVSSITNGKILLSNGTIVNFMNSLSNKCAGIIDSIKTKVLNSNLMYTDATTARCDNKNICVRNYSNKEYTLLLATNGKSKKDIEEANILPRYTGSLVHDHETVIYNYGDKHSECNVHVSRYLKGNFENTNNKWSLDMRNFLCSLNEYKKNLLVNNINKVDDKKISSYIKRYDEIIQKGYAENKTVKSKYLKQEKIKLLNRLKKYKDNHLLFMIDFNMPFDNNLSERDLRHVKSKQKISGYFKSMTGIQNYLNIKSIISSCKKQSKNFYDLIFNIFENTPVEI